MANRPGPELLEEAGARPLSVEVVGSLRFRTEAPEPYRPCQPHPEFHQVVSFTDVEIVGRPTNPEGGEHVIGVELVPIDDALERLRAENPFEGELLAYVVGCRGQRSDRDGSSL